jgi:hypothetical protein
MPAAMIVVVLSIGGARRHGECTGKQGCDCEKSSEL